MNQQSALPSFEYPPVVETAMGMEFAPLSALGFVQIGRLFELWRDRYPVFEELEPYGSNQRMTPSAGSHSWELVPGVPPVRIVLSNPETPWIVQAQNDRLISNWRSGQSGYEYPRYAVAREEYLRLWSEFNAHLTSNDLESPVPVTAAFSYVNRVIVPSDSGPHAAFSLFNEPSVDMPGQPSFLRFQVIRDIQPKDDMFSGQVIVTGEPDFADGEQLYQVTIATRLSVPAGSAIRDIEGSLDAARAVGVRTFASITTPEMHDLWGRK